MTFRCRALLDLAKGMPCMFNVEGVCNHDDSTTVACHSNEQAHGKGMGLKAADVFWAAGCSACHAWYDNGPAPREAKRAAFRQAYDRTQLYLWAHGLVRVA